MENYCNNCGNVGHLYKHCKFPIMSYGVLLFHNNNEGNKKIIMVERKDTISYIEFMRGKYKTIYNIDYIKLLLSRFSNNEKERILKNTFEELWKSLWIHTETINYKIKKEYDKSYDMFQRLKNGLLYNGEYLSLEKLIESTKDTYELNEWEIPKGRRNNRETNKECAIREFCEETNLKKEMFSIINNLVPFTEEYTGINNVRYKHIYYIGIINELVELGIDKNNKEQYTEIKDIKWFNEKECLFHIRDYNISKKKVVQKFFHFLKTYENFTVLK